jgi:hypothetical protein
LLLLLLCVFYYFIYFFLTNRYNNKPLFWTSRNWQQGRRGDGGNAFLLMVPTATMTTEEFGAIVKHPVASVSMVVASSKSLQG